MSIQFKRGTSTQRENVTDSLLAGQPFFETDTNKLYIGKASTALKDLVALNNADAVLAGNNTFTGENTFQTSTVQDKSVRFIGNIKLIDYDTNPDYVDQSKQPMLDYTGLHLYNKSAGAGAGAGGYISIQYPKNITHDTMFATVDDLASFTYSTSNQTLTISNVDIILNG